MFLLARTHELMHRREDIYAHWQIPIAYHTLPHLRGKALCIRCALAIFWCLSSYRLCRLRVIPLHANAYPRPILKLRLLPVMPKHN
jgi:hypothetical protein